MANLKDIKIRRATVSTMKKTIDAMKNISIARLKKNRTILENIRDYETELRLTLSMLLQDPDSPKFLDDASNQHFFSKIIHFNGYKWKDSSSHKVLIVVISPDKGLCGSLNSNLQKALITRINDIIAKGDTPLILPIGKKISAFVKTKYSQFLAIQSFDCLSSKFHLPESQKVVKYLIDMHQKGFIKESFFLYVHFTSPLKQDVIIDQFTPKTSSQNEDLIPHGSLNFECEPDEVNLVEDILSKILAIELERKVLETLTSEHSARMMAMENSSSNAKTLIKNLTTQYNRARQAIITSQMLEIIAGKEAMQ